MTIVGAEPSSGKSTVPTGAAPDAGPATPEASVTSGNTSRMSWFAEFAYQNTNVTTSVVATAAGVAAGAGGCAGWAAACVDCAVTTGVPAAGLASCRAKAAGVAAMPSSSTMAMIDRTGAAIP